MSTIQERIAALNMGHVGRTPGSPTPQPATTRPAVLPRSNSTDEQSSHTLTSHVQSIGNQPNVEPSRPPPPQRPEPKRMPPPPRPPGYVPRQRPPPLPSRDSQQSIPRRGSEDSVTSTVSTRSSLSLPSTRTSTSVESRAAEPPSRVKAPVYDPTNLPALPPSRREQPTPAGRPSLPAKNSSSASTRTLNNAAVGQTTPPPRPTPATQAPATARPGLPPRPPPRAQASQAPQAITPKDTQNIAQHQPAIHHRSNSEVVPAKSTPPIRSALSFGLNKSTQATPTTPSRPSHSQDTSTTNGDAGSPPPIPFSSRPDLAALQASKPRPALSATRTPSYSNPTYAAAPTGDSCLLCRDFSGPDNHAARFPREGLPSQDLAWLGQQLTKPFPSPTDKARAIFTWLHHNISYDTEAFFSGNLRPSTPASTLASGWAVCEGYAGLFAALATHAGLEAVVVGGHGKGYGYAAGTPVPAEGPTGHAWNAVKIDGGEWKLTDPCWGAGHICDAARLYKKHFSPSQFTMSNADFGLSHFPQNARHLHVAAPPSFAEYWQGRDGPGEPVQIFSGCADKFGVGETTFLPRKKMIAVRALGAKARVLFRFSTVCEHWDHRAKGLGAPYVFVLSVNGVDGRKKDILPFKHDAKHQNWWLEVPVEGLGCPGQSVSINNVTTVGGEDAKGWTVQRFLEARGRKGMSWGGVAAWQLV